MNDVHSTTPWYANLLICSSTTNGASFPDEGVPKEPVPSQE